ncbi:UNVERIFIED_CONTAM: hypothetical protein Slati_4424500 [Sesamum latifolium]|uniref:Uncharacterized protein n=1 Tax=Sesamum latifolium TaxID=2727402 RepID=A0AAW2SQ72_9LAMI
MRRMGPMDDFNDMVTDTELIDAVLKGNHSSGPTKESGRYWTEFYIPGNGLKTSTVLEFCTSQEDFRTTILSSSMQPKLRTKGRHLSNFKTCG